MWLLLIAVLWLVAMGLVVAFMMSAHHDEEGAVKLGQRMNKQFAIEEIFALRNDLWDHRPPICATHWPKPCDCHPPAPSRQRRPALLVRNMMG